MDTNFVTAIFLPLALGVIMFGMGMSLTLSDFRRVVYFPKAAAIGLVNQLVFLPVLALGIAWLFTLTPPLAVGMMILAVCPGGPTSNLISYLCRADVALSISLTAISSVVTVATIPLLVQFSLDFFVGVDERIRLPLWDSVLKILVITLLPTALGMAFHVWNPALCRRAVRWVNPASTLLFMIVLAGAIYSQKEELAGFFRVAGVAALLLNALTMLCGYFSALWSGLDRRQQLTISIESGLQNGTLAITIAASPLLLNRPDMAVFPAIYSLVMFFSSGFLILASRLRPS